ncbi:MAG: hypothetical protein ACI4IE_06915 [Eubacterium sp.]
MHPFCRSVTVPDTASRNGTRWARDPVTGKSITVPADMTYSQWYDKYVKGNPKALKKEHEAKNILSDRKQYEKYKGILGDKAPETLEKFITIKYNEEDKEWEQLKSLTVSKNFLQNQLPYIINGEKNFIPIHTKFDTTPKVIAGVGTNNPIRSIERLINLYGGTENEWQKKVVKIKSDKYIFDVHWYEYNGLQYEVKLKHRKERKA